MKFFLVMLFLLFRYSEAQNAAVSLLIPGLFAKFFYCDQLSSDKEDEMRETSLHEPGLYFLYRRAENVTHKI